MADYSMPGVVFDPATATPEQLKYMRELAMQLATPPRAEDIAPHWTGALAAGLRGITGPLYANRANELQQQAIRGAAQQSPSTDMISQMLRLLQQGQGRPQGQGVPPAAAPPTTAPQQNVPTSAAPDGSAQPTSYAGAPQGNAQDAISNALKASILQQESGNRSNIGNSVAGAVGPGQIMPETFRMFARPGERINDPNANREVSGRILDTYMQKYGDPARAAVAYFSGPGNVAPPGSPTPWISDRKDGYGKSVSSYVSDVTRRMGGGGQQVAQAGQSELSQRYNAYQHNPWANPHEQNLQRGLITPVPGQDVYGMPTVTAPMFGQQGLPSGGGAVPGVNRPLSVSPEGGVTTTIPQPAPGYGGATAQNPQQQIQPFVTMGQQFGQQAAQNKAVQEAINTDTKMANDSIQVRTVLRTMKDDLMAHGGQMVWGPTSEWVTNLKRALAQHAPGVLSKDQIEGLASADSFDKLSAQLQTFVGRMAGNTDLSLMQGHRSVPGSQNSQQGALALIDMLDQAAGINAQWEAEKHRNIGKPGYNYMEAKREFFDRNKIVNPITRNPISIDLAKPAAGETKVINGKTYTKINGVWHEGM